MTAVACQKFVQSILELPATDEIHMEDRKKVWLELSPELIRPMADKIRKTVNRIARKQGLPIWCALFPLHNLPTAYLGWGIAYRGKQKKPRREKRVK